MQAQKDINKVIDKYRIQKILQTKPNNICIMKAINQTTSQPFIIKKANIGNTDKNSSQSHQTRESNAQSGLLYHEVNCIKDMNMSRILKCLQMIKTKRSLYLVYENYPQLNLQRYIKERAPVPALKIRFAKIICQFLQEMHKKKYIYTTLMPSSVYVITGSNINPSSYQLRFSGFQYAAKLKEEEFSTQVDVSSLGQSPYIAPEVVKNASASFQSDIYSAGKIFQLLGITSIKGKTDHKLANQTISDMLNQNPQSRSNLNKIWQCLKLKQNETRLFDHTILQLQINTNRNKFDVAAIGKQKSTVNKNIQKRNIEDEQRRIRKIIKIRTLVIYLHDLANFTLRERFKVLFYMLIKKSVIIRANLIHQIKKMVSMHSGPHYNQLNNIKQVLIQQQSQALNLLAKVQQALKSEKTSNSYAHLVQELQNRNQLNQQFIEQLITEFVNKKKRQIKPFHSILQQKQRSKLIYLCGLSEKLVYGSFEKFFDQVVDDHESQLSKQKYFIYLKAASTKQICDRLQKILKDKAKK